MLAWGYQAARRCNIPEINFRTVRGLALMLDTAVLVGPGLHEEGVLIPYGNEIGSQSLTEQERLNIFNHHIKRTYSIYSSHVLLFRAGTQSSPESYARKNHSMLPSNIE